MPVESLRCVLQIVERRASLRVRFPLFTVHDEPLDFDGNPGPKLSKYLIALIMELFRKSGANGLPDNFPFRQKDRLFL